MREPINKVEIIGLKCVSEALDQLLNEIDGDSKIFGLLFRSFTLRKPRGMTKEVDPKSLQNLTFNCTRLKEIEISQTKELGNPEFIEGWLAFFVDISARNPPLEKVIFSGFSSKAVHGKKIISTLM